MTLIHSSFQYTDNTQHTKNNLQDATIELQNIQIKNNHSWFNIINIYIPPVSRCPRNYKPQLQNIPNIPNLFIGGDLNAHHHSWYIHQTQDERGETLLQEWQHLNILNNKNLPTRLPYQNNQKPTSPDLSLCSPELQIQTTWNTIPELSSDHQPIIISHHLQHHITQNNKKNFINYNKARWPQFTQEIENKLHNFDTANFTSIDKATTHFTVIIKTASKKYIPQGYRKTYIPHYTPEIARLVEQRNNLKTRINNEQT
jgi:hypothetical protein